MKHCTRQLAALALADQESVAGENDPDGCYTASQVGLQAMSPAVKTAKPTRIIPRRPDRVAVPQIDALAPVILRLRSRDPDALASLYDQTVAKVLALASAMMRDRADADELVCDVYERAWSRAETFDGSRGTVLAWLLTICRSQALDRLRRRRAQLRTREAYGREPSESTVAGPENALDRFQQGHAVHAALAALTPQRRRMIALAFFGGLSHQEIAAELGMPLGTVKSHLRRGLTELRERLGFDGFHDED